MYTESKTTSPANTPDDDYTDRLQFAGQEEGRIRYIPANTAVTPNVPAYYSYDYFIKDHLGNVRMVLAEAEEQTAYPAATLEDSRIATEQQLYDIVPGRIEALPTPVKNDHPSLEEKAYRVRGVTGEKTGLGIVLKVMAGDQVGFKAESYYAPPPGGNPGNTSSLVASQLLDAFASGLAGAGKSGITGTELLSNTDLADAAEAFLTDPDRTPASGVPRAYLNYMLFDDQLNSLGGGFDKVDPGSGNGYKLHTEFFSNPVAVTKNGYLYIYTSNESDLKVLFDNLQVTHQKGRLLEETHYYPFGLTMAGISSKAMGKLENRYKFNEGTELNSDFDINLYETDFRSYDPQIGRFHQIDPLADLSKNWSPYIYASNNPILRNDPFGLKDTVINGETVQRDRDLDNYTVTAKVSKKLPSLDNSSVGGMPYAEINSIALDRNESDYLKINHLRSITTNPTISRNLDGAILKNILSGTVLNAMDKMFTAIDFTRIGMSLADPNSPLEIPFIGSVTQMLVNDMVSSSDEMTLDVASKQGYIPMARVMNSSVGRRNGLVGVYTDKQTMQAILASGGLNMRIHQVTGSAGSYSDNPRDAGGNKFDYFIIFPKSSGSVITNFGAMRIH